MKRKAESLLNKIHRLQAEIYNFNSFLEDKATKTNDSRYFALSELASSSAFELQASHQNMQALLDKIND